MFTVTSRSKNRAAITASSILAVAVFSPAVASHAASQPSTVVSASPTLGGKTAAGKTTAGKTTAGKKDTKPAGRVAKPSRSSAPSRFGTVSYNKWYAYMYMSYKYGWGKKQRKPLTLLWQRESGWSQHARNPSSGAHGIPQALPGSKMRSEGSDWYSNPETQIRWGLSYIKQRYGTPAGAWAASERQGWY